jgi:hypothetical protein
MQKLLDLDFIKMNESVSLKNLEDHYSASTPN